MERIYSLYLVSKAIVEKTSYVNIYDISFADIANIQLNKFIGKSFEIMRTTGQFSYVVLRNKIYFIFQFVYSNKLEYIGTVSESWLSDGLTNRYEQHDEFMSEAVII